MRLYAFLISSSILGLATAFPRADYGAGNHKGKVCTLEKSATKTKEDCFYEPECEDKCQDVTKNVCKPVEEQDCKIVDVPECKIIEEDRCSLVYENMLVDDCVTRAGMVCKNNTRTQCIDVEETKCETQYEAITEDVCNTVIENDCHKLEKEVCKNFPEDVCKIVDTIEIQQKCEPFIR